MPWLSLRRLLPPRKVWKLFTNKLQLKLHKLNKSKAIPFHSSHKTSKKLTWPSLSIRPKKFKLKPKIPHTLITHQNLHKRPPPVYIDQLFIESGSTTKERQMQPPVAMKEVQESRSSKNRSFDQKKRSPDQLSGDKGKEISMMNDESNISTADEMWESLVLASPAQMHGINERADAFIARFRADMHNQEMLLARRRL